MTSATRVHDTAPHAVRIDIAPALTDRDRLTVAFRPLLALPHLLLVGGPIAVLATSTASDDPLGSLPLGAGGGALGVAAVAIAVVAWFSILFTDRYPRDLYRLAVLYLRWRVRAVAYLTLLRDEYPPFGEGRYPASIVLEPPASPRDRFTVLLRPILALPHFFALWLLGAAWAVTTLAAWVVILFSGRMPRGLFRFGVGVLRWSTRVEAYLLLLTDEYPPFALEMP